MSYSYGLFLWSYPRIKLSQDMVVCNMYHREYVDPVPVPLRTAGHLDSKELHVFPKEAEEEEEEEEEGKGGG
jgi:hypothetical protein